MKRFSLIIILLVLVIALPAKAFAQSEEANADTQRVDTPQVDAPQVDALRVETPQVETPPVDTSQVDASAVETESVETQPVETMPQEIESQETRELEEIEADQLLELVNYQEDEISRIPQLELRTDDGFKWLDFDATIQTVLLYQNDSNFDGTKPFYDANGQTVGILGTFFKPRLTLMPIEEIKIVWEMEMGLNLWSRYSYNQYASGRTDTFRLAQRELYAEGIFLNGAIGFKAGYSYFEDPTALFIGHWLGSFGFSANRGWAQFSFTIAQMPDQTFEGIGLDANNFQHDTFVYGLRVDVPFENWHLAIALFGLHDSEVVDQTLNLFSPSIRLTADYEWINFGLDLVFQAGTTYHGAALEDEEIMAYAIQAFAEFNTENLKIEINQLVLSGDDKYDRNGKNRGFYYSGKSRSRTLILTENSIRDLGANLDERLSEKRGKFYVMRPGLSVTDLTFSYDVYGFFAPALILGAGFVLEPDNALGGKMVGIETDLDLEFKYSDIVSFHLIGGLLLPGKAASAFLNDYDKDSTRIIYMFESSLSVMF